jgi:Raf kinase inhibitor-like YbhB/YbcL family protein
MRPLILLAAPLIAAATPFTVSIPGLPDGARLPPRYAFCQAGPDGHQAPAPDISPPLTWTAGPAGTRSYAILMQDPDVPESVTAPEMKSGIPPDAPRRIFNHWALADIPARLRGLPEGADSTGPLPHGKPATTTPYGTRGANDFTTAFVESSQYNGIHGGYDGPCPPSIDLLVHRYRIHLFALDTATLALDTPFSADDLQAALKHHTLAEATTTVTYTTHRLAGLGQAGHR